MKKSYLIAAGAGAVLLAVALGWWWSQRGGATDVQYRTGKVERGPLQSAVSASGAVSPVTQVTVGTQVSGQIKDLYVDFNSEVKAGQLIAVIDPETFEYRVRSAQADVDAARAVVQTALANVVAAKAQVSRAQTDLAEARRTHERNLMLVDKGFIAQSTADQSSALVNTSAESVKAAEAQLGVTQAQVQSAQASVAQREAALAQARVDLARTRITSPVSGIVIKRTIEKGQTVAASLQAPELFIIARNLRDMQVEASIDEADVGRIRSGQKASFTVDAFPGRTFEGQISQVRKAALNVSNVVTYVAVVTFSNTDGRLLPGMTANVRVITDQRDNVLKVPNAALRVRIAGVEPAAAAAPAPQDAPPAAAPAAGGNNPMTEFRNRLVRELQLDAAQTEKVDAIYASARPRFMQLRELPEAERTKARERITADIRARIAEVLTPEQKKRYAEMQAEQAGRTITRGRIYVPDALGRPKALNVRLGITDGTQTELIVAPGSPEAADLQEGASVITGVLGGNAASAPRPGGAPRMMF
ncbi:MAG: efflux RND transporter periplasmic adaptor subunit [Hylemonella sp.]|uniref:efflux RND transporter periplasmic adaptor subunit n=1 Tax=Hylemonella sp. TaxID=2066020 RepID=UPI0022C292FF|nr:efflux RND transporter periplasmic adaptor subunit [Hylemonella sp.]MCZ8252170.1 efflux RND transporter periplasmic adaptor subunit [Hylemonella sp.]